MDWTIIAKDGLPKLYGDYLFQECLTSYCVESLWDDEAFRKLEEVPDFYEAWIKIEGIDLFDKYDDELIWPEPIQDESFEVEIDEGYIRPIFEIED